MKRTSDPVTQGNCLVEYVWTEIMGLSNSGWKIQKLSDNFSFPFLSAMSAVLCVCACNIIGVSGQLYLAVVLLLYLTREHDTCDRLPS